MRLSWKEFFPKMINVEQIAEYNYSFRSLLIFATLQFNLRSEEFWSNVETANEEKNTNDSENSIISAKSSEICEKERAIPGNNKL